MRKTQLFVLCALAALGALIGTGAKAQAQETLYDVDLSVSRATVSSFTSALTKQTGILFSYETELASKPLGNVTIRQNQATL